MQGAFMRYYCNWFLSTCRSERVSKTGVNGLLLTEAKYINLSLHYLEQVIAHAIQCLMIQACFIACFLQCFDTVD